MKIVFTAKGGSWDSQIDPRFGRMETIVIYDEEKDQLDRVDNSRFEELEHRAGFITAQRVLELNPDIIITGNGPGRKALEVLDQASIRIYVGAEGMSIKEAYKAFKEDRLVEFS